MTSLKRVPNEEEQKSAIIHNFYCILQYYYKRDNICNQNLYELSRFLEISQFWAEISKDWPIFQDWEILKVIPLQKVVGV